MVYEDLAATLIRIVIFIHTSSNTSLGLTMRNIPALIGSFRNPTNYLVAHFDTCSYSLSNLSIDKVVFVPAYRSVMPFEVYDLFLVMSVAPVE